MIDDWSFVIAAYSVAALVLGGYALRLLHSLRSQRHAYNTLPEDQLRTDSVSNQEAAGSIPEQ